MGHGSSTDSGVNFVQIKLVRRGEGFEKEALMEGNQAVQGELPKANKIPVTGFKTKHTSEGLQNLRTMTERTTGKKHFMALNFRNLSLSAVGQTRR